MSKQNLLNDLQSFENKIRWQEHLNSGPYGPAAPPKALFIPGFYLWRVIVKHLKPLQQQKLPYLSIGLNFWLMLILVNINVES